MIQTIALQIKNTINNCLPGEVAHLKMSSEIRMNDFIFRKEHENSKKCGVLILLFPFNNKIYSALILRAEYDGIHSGQVALPGGKYEKTDLNIIQTAIRETSEEIGVKMNDIHIIGSLTKLYIPPSDYIVYPSIGYVSAKPEFIPDSNEVKKVIEYSIETLLDETIIKTKEFHINANISFNAPFFEIENHIVWGATAMILSEFKEILKKINFNYLR